jgi:hypothetical protein
MHYQRWQRHGDPLQPGRIVGDDKARLWSKIDRRGDDECWPWTGALFPTGYGAIQINGKVNYAHRVVHGLLVGSIPDGLVLDHICHKPDECEGGDGCPHRRCVNPHHLAVGTYADNNAPDRISSAQRRKTHCPQGHPYDAANTYLYRGGRNCRKCARARIQAFYARRKAVK